MSDYVLPSLGVLLGIALALVAIAWVLVSMYDESRLTLEPGEKVLGKGYGVIARDNDAPLSLDSIQGCLFWTDRRLMWRPLLAFGPPIDIWYEGVALEGQDVFMNPRLWVRTGATTFRFTVSKRNRDAICRIRQATRPTPCTRIIEPTADVGRWTRCGHERGIAVD